MSDTGVDADTDHTDNEESAPVPGIRMEPGLELGRRGGNGGGFSATTFINH